MRRGFDNGRWQRRALSAAHLQLLLAPGARLLLQPLRNLVHFKLREDAVV